MYKFMLLSFKWATVLMVLAGLSSCTKLGEAQTLKSEQLEEAKKQAIDATGGAANQAVGNLNQAVSGAGGL